MTGRRAGSLVRAALGAPCLAVAAGAGYLAALTVAAATARRSGPAAASGDPEHRFVVLIPAHDEAALIGRAVRSALDTGYPSDLVSVHVVADNCTDATAKIAREEGAVVWERTDAARPGKGPALNWALDQLAADGVPFDTLVVVDADSELLPGFFHAVAEARGGGARVVQASYGVADPGASTAAAARYAALACRHHTRPLGRTRVGASSGLYGNGMAFDRALATELRWSDHLVEDAEMQLELLGRGVLVRYAPDARLVAEMPDELGAATTQNERWERGRQQLVRRFGPRLLRRAVTGPRRLAHADALADMLMPPLSVLCAAAGASTAMACVVARLRPGGPARRCAISSAVSLLALAAHVVVSLRMVRAPRAVYRSLTAAPRLVAWKVLLWCRVLVRPASVEWRRTRRNADAAGG